MQRIINHWTAGTYKVTSADRSHYHIIIDGDGNEVEGNYSIAANENTRDGEYAAHTQGSNTGSIGVSICAMAGAVESPLDFGKYPVKEIQWQKLIEVNARLCRDYNIPVTRKTVLSHAEVQETLGIKQRGKWDIAHLPFMPDVKGARAIGDVFRAEVLKAVKAGPKKDALTATPKPILKSRRVQSTVLGFMGGGGAFSIAALDGFDWAGIAIIVGAAIAVGLFFWFVYRKEIEAGLFAPAAKR